TIALKCLSKEPDSRYASAKDLADDVARWLGDEPIHARPAGPIERAVKWARRRPGAAITLAGALAGVAALAALTVFASYQWRNADEHRIKAENAVARQQQEEHARALAQVNALRDAAPGAVPGILAE